MVNDKDYFVGWLWFYLSDCRATFLYACHFHHSVFVFVPGTVAPSCQISRTEDPTVDKLAFYCGCWLWNAAHKSCGALDPSHSEIWTSTAVTNRHGGSRKWKSEKPQKSLAYHRLYHLINILHLSSPNALLRSGQAIWILHMKINALWKSFKAPNAFECLPEFHSLIQHYLKVNSPDTQKHLITQ